MTSREWSYRGLTLRLESTAHVGGSFTGYVFIPDGHDEAFDGYDVEADKAWAESGTFRNVWFERTEDGHRAFASDLMVQNGAYPPDFDSAMDAVAWLADFVILRMVSLVCEHEGAFPRPVRRWWYDGLECLLIKGPDHDGFAGWYCGYVRVPDGSALDLRRRGDVPRAYQEIPVDLQFAAGRDVNFSGVPHGSHDGFWLGFDMGATCDYAVGSDGMPDHTQYLRTENDAVVATERLAHAIHSYIHCEDR